MYIYVHSIGIRKNLKFKIFFLNNSIRYCEIKKLLYILYLTTHCLIYFEFKIKINK